MEPGEISAPVILLEGVAIFRLDERVKPTLNPLKEVRERASQLYQRNMGEKAWEDLTDRLKAETRIEYNDAPWR
jgi:parvulin-like peptidyl-prolyl isomerase